MILNMSPWSLVGRYQRFYETRCLHLLHWGWRWKIPPKCYRTTERYISEAGNRNIRCRENLISYYSRCLKANCWGEYVRNQVNVRAITQAAGHRGAFTTFSSRPFHLGFMVHIGTDFSPNTLLLPFVIQGSSQTPVSPPLRYATHRTYDHVTLSQFGIPLLTL
jgi:hypothetical protein